MLKALFPGSFDPPTNGHLNIVRRTVSICERLFIVIASNPDKRYTFTAEERRDLLQELTAEYSNVEIYLWNRLIVDFARQVGARIIFRGVRALDDFEYEFQLSMINRGLDPEIETILMPTDPQYFVLRSSAIKELARLGGDISSMVPPIVARKITERLRIDRRHPPYATEKD